MIMDKEENNRLTEEMSLLRERLNRKDKEIDDLKTTNLFLSTIFDGISEEIMVLDRDFNINDVNKTFLKRHGLRRASVLGRKCYEIKERSRVPCHLKGKSCPHERAIKTGETIELTHSHEDSNGDLREHLVVMYPLRSGRNRIKYFVEISRDVTEYRQLIRGYQASEKKFRAIFDTATNAIISIDEDHKIILFNNAAQRIFGYSGEEVLGESLNLIIPPGYGDHQENVLRSLESRESSMIGKTISLTGLRKNGEEFPIELSLSILEMEGKITFTAIIRDVSEHKKLETKLLHSERLAAVGHAVAHVAHELKNPLMIIGGFSNQIRKALNDYKDIQKIDMILDEVRRLENLVASLGDFTRKYSLIKRPADVNSVLKDVVNIMASAHPQGKYYFKKNLSPELEEINCDPDKLKQVFINIISNGLEAMSEGGTITVSTNRTPQGIEVRINDEGIGIPYSDLEHIFEPFYTTREKGSGLGLSISYKIIEAHDGDISAFSSPGRGTTFFLRLPAN
jgi:two-component system sensor kinase FixL